MENEYDKLKNSISSEPLNVQSKEESLEDEYIFELNMDEEDLKEKLEEENRECIKLLKNAEKNSNDLDEEVEYIIKNAKKEAHIVKALGEIINREITKNKKLSINLLDDYLKLIKDDNIKIKKLLKLKNNNYQYKEIILLKIAEIEIDNLKNVLLKDSVNIDEKINYILSILEQAELLSKNNGTKVYLIHIYKVFSKLYNLDLYIKDENKSKEYLKKVEKINTEIEKNRQRRDENSESTHKNTTIENVNEKNSESKKTNNKIIFITVAIISILICVNAGMYIVNSNNINDTVQSNLNEGNHQIQEAVEEEPYSDSSDEEMDNEMNSESRNNTEGMSSEPTVKKSLPTRYSEYGDYSSTKQSYFMEQEDLLTEYYTDYEKAVSNADYSYVRGDLVDDGQLSKELKISIPQYKHKSVYVKHFSIYNLEMHGDDQATFSLDTVFVVDNERIQIETQKMTTYYDYYNQRWLIDNYKDWDIIYKQDYNPDIDYFDFTNYRDYF